MTYSTVYPVWNALRDRFQITVDSLPEEDLKLELGTTTIGSLLQHTAEVEYLFAEWFFGKEKPKEIAKPSLTDLEGLVDLLSASNAHLVEAMQALPEEEWQKTVVSRMGESTPLEAIGRLMYHAGIHAGQITLIRKNGQNPDE